METTKKGFGFACRINGLLLTKKGGFLLFESTDEKTLAVFDSWELLDAAVTENIGKLLPDSYLVESVPVRKGWCVV